MKNENIKYLLINGDEILKQSYMLKRSNILFVNRRIYVPGEKRTAKDFFDRYKIKEEFQQIIIRINPYTNEASEYITGIPLYITGSKVSEQNQGKNISGDNLFEQYSKQILKEKISFSSKVKILSENDVNMFLKKLNDNDLIQDYTYALNDFFETFIYFASQKSTIIPTKKRMLRKPNQHSNKR